MAENEETQMTQANAGTSPCPPGPETYPRGSEKPPPEKDFNLQKTLRHLNENIGTMAELLQSMVKQSKGKTKSKKRKRSSSSHSESDSSTESSPEDEPTDNKRSRIDDGERLSIHASENEMEEDYKTLGLTEPTKVVTDPDDKESDEILLKELAESLDDNEATGDNVKTQLADIVNKRWGKKLSAEKIKNFLGRYKTPANCTDLVTARTENEIWVQLNGSQRKADLQVANIQQNLQKIAIATVNTANDLLEAKTGAKVDHNKLVTNMIDSIALLGHASHELTGLRRRRLQPALKQEYAALCSMDIPPSKYLFGDDLAKRLRDIKETSKISQAFTATRGGKFQKQNNTRPRFNPAKPYRSYKGNFLGKGQPKYRKRKHPSFAEQHEKP